MESVRVRVARSGELSRTQAHESLGSGVVVVRAGEQPLFRGTSDAMAVCAQAQRVSAVRDKIWEQKRLDQVGHGVGEKSGAEEGIAAVDILYRRGELKRGKHEYSGRAKNSGTADGVGLRPICTVFLRSP